MIVKRLNEIAARKAAIGEELREADAARVKALNEETDALLKEEAELRGRADLEGKLKPPAAPAWESEAERRAARFAETRKMTIKASETRNVLVSSGKIAAPTEVGGINDPFNVVSSIVDQVRVEDMTGCGEYKEAYITAWGEAGRKTEGEANAPSEPTFKMAAIKPFLLNVTGYVSREIAKQTPLNYAQKVQQGAMTALRKKIGEWIVTGDGSAAIYGILNARNTENEAICAEEEISAIDESTLKAIVFAYGGDENVGQSARLFLNKKDLISFGKVRGSDKKAVYEITPDGTNPNTGVIREGGLAVPYTINSACVDVAAATAGDVTMFYGAPANYKLGLFGDYEVRVDESYKFAEGLLTIMGEVTVGGNVVVDKGFVLVRKGS